MDEDRLSEMSGLRTLASMREQEDKGRDNQQNEKSYESEV